MISFFINEIYVYVDYSDIKNKRIVYMSDGLKRDLKFSKIKEALKI